MTEPISGPMLKRLNARALFSITRKTRVHVRQKADALPHDPAQLRQLGDVERDRRNWAGAAFYYNMLLRVEVEDAALWLQHGHMLKESGLFAEAAVSYEKALALRANEPEAYLQLAILCKVRRDFQGATRLYHEARLHGYQPEAFIEEELTFLGKTSGVRLSTRRPDKHGTMLYLSSASAVIPDADPQRLKAFLGATNYSYAYAMKGFQEALDAAGYSYQVIQNPEYIADIRERSSAANNIHLGFHPPDGPRFLKGAYNVLCVAWEFERLKNQAETLSYHAFADPTALLSMSQEIWATSSYAAEALRRSGLQNVLAVSTPVPAARERGRAGKPALPELQRIAAKLDRIQWVPLAIWSAMQSTLNMQSVQRGASLLNLLLETDDEGETPTFFISVFNVHDFRKQIKPVLEAFSRFTKTYPDAYLLLKISCVDGDNTNINEILFAAQVKDDGEITPALINERILLTTNVLSRQEMIWFYDLASYYVCSSHAEGQNLPLIEAMGRGVVPVSVNETAMRDYINNENAVVIASERRPMTRRLSARYGLYGVATYFVERDDVLRAASRAMLMTNSDYASLSDKAVSTVTEQFGLAPFTKAVDELIAKLDSIRQKGG